MQHELLLAVCIFVAAVLYSSVGHAGASGYLAAMALAGVEPQTMKPTALMLNILVASIATIRYYNAGCFSFRLFWPFALGAVPLAFAGGAMQLSGHLYKQLVGAVLLLAAIRLSLGNATKAQSIRDVPAPVGSWGPNWAVVGWRLVRCDTY